MYLELKVPQNNSSLRDALNDIFNKSSNMEKNCDECGNSNVLAEMRSQLIDASDTNFLLVILSRGIQTMEGFNINQNNVIMTDEVHIR